MHTVRHNLGAPRRTAAMCILQTKNPAKCANPFRLYNYKRVRTTLRRLQNQLNRQCLRVYKNTLRCAREFIYQIL